MTEITTLTVRLESDEEFHEEVREQLTALEESNDITDPHVLSLPDEQALSRVLSPANIELIRTIATAEPSSMRETARLVDRDIKEVSRNLNELAELGVIRFETEGRSKRPIVWFDRIEVDIDFPTTSETGTTSAAP
jgi:predicted transcriptional regulator